MVMETVATAPIMAMATAGGTPATAMVLTATVTVGDYGLTAKEPVANGGLYFLRIQEALISAPGLPRSKTRVEAAWDW